MFPEQRFFHASDPDAPTTPALRRRLAAEGRYIPSGQQNIAVVGQRCRLCGCSLGRDAEADPTIHACGSCKCRPEARRLRVSASGETAAGGFSDAEKSLIRKIHGYVPPRQLLGILNDRLLSDLGPNATPYTAEQLHAEIVAISGTARPVDNSWATLRKLLSRAERDGTLQRVSEQVVADFAVVFSLSPKQLMRLKEILLQSPED
jgi:hypothetical protein